MNFFSIGFLGNSRTVFIACISSSDSDLAESLNTLTYANEAKRIKNKVTINRKDTSQTLMILQKEVERLRKELEDIREVRRPYSMNH
jgi:kinesin family protein 4/21/27